MPFVYIMTNGTNSVLYTGVTNSLEKRYFEHVGRIHTSSFVSQYQINKLVYFEEHDSIRSAIEREKQIKGGSRAKKIILIERLNPEWNDLSGT